MSIFDYKQLEEDLVLQMEQLLKKYTKEHKDIYIAALDCSRDMNSVGVIANTRSYLKQQADCDSEDYWYYKYCEEEWELFHTFEEISSYMRKYIEENQKVFSDSKTYEYMDVFDAHCDQVIETCKKALCRVRELPICKSDLLLTFNIREFLEEEEKAAVFKAVNGVAAALEYMEHIEDFC